MLWRPLGRRLSSLTVLAIPHRPALPRHATGIRRTSLVLSTAASSQPPSAGTAGNMEKLVFDNRALKNLPVDSETKNYVRTVSGVFLPFVVCTRGNLSVATVCTLISNRVPMISESTVCTSLCTMFKIALAVHGTLLMWVST